MVDRAPVDEVARAREYGALLAERERAQQLTKTPSVFGDCGVPLLYREPDAPQGRTRPGLRLP